MGIWKASSIEETPSIELKDWCVYEVSSKLWPEKTRHFCGYNLTEREGRVSSKITEFDSNLMIGKTRSGRIYKLIGESGTHPDAQWVWNFFTQRNKLSDVNIVDIKNISSNELE